MINKRKSSLAFSLVEVMVGMVILGILFLSLPAAYVSVRKAGFESDTMIRASSLVSAELELLRTSEYVTLQSMVGTSNVATYPSVNHPLRADIQFTVNVTIVNGTNELSGMLEAVAAVQWMENGRSREAIGRAFFAEDGLSDKKFPDATI